MSPKINEATIGEQRAMRQQQIIDAAMGLALTDGAHSVTVSAVAKSAGISRSLVYEYFASSADLIADLVLEELQSYRIRLETAVVGAQDPYSYIENWISEALQYIADGRHLLVKSLNSISTPEFRRAEIAQGHRDLMSTIVAPLAEIKMVDISRAITYLQSVIDAAAKRIDAGNSPELEIQSAKLFAVAGIRALVSA
ncbi:MAG: hypothetical protein RL381_197 [Actinomycetota bacterium]|jgi:AcrR family transcriptional regulator